MSRRTMALGMIVTACLFLPGSTLHSQNAIDSLVTNEGWTNVQMMSGGDKDWFQDLIDRTNWNLSAYPKGECKRVADAADAMLSLGNELWYWGDHTGVYGMHSEFVTASHGGGHWVAFDKGTVQGNDALALETFLEEAAHHAANPPTIDPRTGDTLAVDTAFVMHSYESTPGATDFRADFATDCGKLKPKEEDDEDDPDGNGGDPVEPVCEEKLVAVYYTVYESEIGTGQTCFSSDDVDGFTWCHGVRANLLVPKTKVKWETQTVCSS